MKSPFLAVVISGAPDKGDSVCLGPRYVKGPQAKLTGLGATINLYCYKPPRLGDLGFLEDNLCYTDGYVTPSCWDIHPIDSAQIPDFSRQWKIFFSVFQQMLNLPLYLCSIYLIDCYEGYLSK